jgi:predicted dehydrogenase
MSVLGALGLARPLSAKSETSPRPSKAKYMGDFAAPKLPTVKCAFIGVGARGSGHCGDIGKIPGVNVVGVCDLYQDLAERSIKGAKAKGHAEAKAYWGGQQEYRKMLAETKPDAVFIATPWEVHAEHCIESMKAGAHAFSEVPIAVTIEEMWKIVDASEATGRHCMMMENVNYGGTELLYLNMCRQGLLGELLHGEAAYIHSLRGQMNQVKRGTGSWRTYHYAKRNGNLYPTHGLGPVAQYMNLARTEDTFASLVSYSSPARGRNLYAKEKYPADHKWNKLDFKGGDMSTSLIKTVLGRTIMVQWDETTPRPYSRHNLIQGTKGVLTGFPNRIAVEGLGNAHGWSEGAAFKEKTAKYEHPLIKRLKAKVDAMGLKGHGGMDGMMRMRIIECLQEGLPLDQNLYEGCFWSAVGPLSEKSVANGGAPQAFPDFTRGEWKNTKPLSVNV